MKFDYRKDYLEVKVNQKELKEIKDTKHEQEIAVASKIMDLLNKAKYSDIEDFYSKNNNLQDFIKGNFEIPLSHFGRNETPLNEEDYINIIENIRIITKKKQSINTDEISTTKIENNEYNSMKIDDEMKFIDNSKSKKDIEERMRDAQKESDESQTVDVKKNSENTFKSIQNSQEGINFVPLKEINRDLLTSDEKELFNYLINFQLDYGSQIKVDLNKGIIVDENNNIMNIKKENGEIMIVSNDGEKEQSLDNQQQNLEEKKSYQKKLVANPNTIYSN